MLLVAGLVHILLFNIMLFKRHILYITTSILVLAFCPTILTNDYILVAVHMWKASNRFHDKAPQWKHLSCFADNRCSWRKWTFLADRVFYNFLPLQERFSLLISLGFFHVCVCLNCVRILSRFWLILHLYVLEISR